MTDSTGSPKILRESWPHPPVPGARALAFIYHITVTLLPESVRDIASVAKVTSRLQECPALEGIQLNHSKSRALMGYHPGRLLGGLPWRHSRHTAEDIGVRVVRLPVVTEAFQRQPMAGTIHTWRVNRASASPHLHYICASKLLDHALVRGHPHYFPPVHSPSIEDRKTSKTTDEIKGDLPAGQK